MFEREREKERERKSERERERERENRGSMWELAMKALHVVASPGPTLRINRLLVYMRCIFVNSIESAAKLYSRHMVNVL